MKHAILIITLTVLKESHPLNPEVLNYVQYMKDFEATGRRMMQETKDQNIDGLVVKRESCFQETTPIAESASATPLQFSDEVCKRICVAAISELFDPFDNFQEKFVEELQKAPESKAHEFSEKLDELSRKVYRRKLLLERVREKTPCDCASEFEQIGKFEDQVDEAYDYLLIRFDKIEEEEYEYGLTEATTSESHTHPGQWLNNKENIHKPFDREWNY